MQRMRAPAATNWKAVHHASIAAKVKRPSSVLAQMNLRSPHLDRRVQQLLLPDLTLRSSARPRRPLLHLLQRARPAPGKDLKQPWYVPQPGATQPTLPVRPPAQSPRPAAAVPKLRPKKVPAHYMLSCVLI